MDEPLTPRDFSENKYIPRSNMRYKIANQDAITREIFMQRVSKIKNMIKQKLSFLWSILLVPLLLLLFFVFSIGLTFYERWLLNMWSYPIAVIVSHLFVKFLFTALVRCMIESHTGQRRVKLSCQSMIKTVALPSIASSVDIGFSNWALQLLANSISLYIMTKSTTVIFVFGFAVLLKLERKSWSLLGTVMMISGGLIMFAYESTEVNLLVLFLALLASFLSGFHWSMTQFIMQESKHGLGNPIDTMYHMQPWMLLSIVPIALWFEGSMIYNDLLNTNWTDTRTISITVLAVLSGGVVAFCMELTQFMIVSRTSSLTLFVSGIFKSCAFILVIGSRIKPISDINFIGLLIGFAGIILYTILKLWMSAYGKNEDSKPNSKSVTLDTDSQLSIIVHELPMDSGDLITSKTCNYINIKLPRKIGDQTIDTKTEILPK